MEQIQSLAPGQAELTMQMALLEQTAEPDWLALASHRRSCYRTGAGWDDHQPICRAA